MMRALTGAFVLLLIALPLLGTDAGEPSEALALDRVHLELRRTLPPADSITHERPVELRLFFSEPPRMEGTRVRLTDAADSLVTSTAATADEEDPRQVFIRFEEPLPYGSYQAHWRVIAQDGHAQNGTFRIHIEAGSGAEVDLRRE